MNVGDVKAQSMCALRRLAVFRSNLVGYFGCKRKKKGSESVSLGKKEFPRNLETHFHITVGNLRGKEGKRNKLSALEQPL